MLNEKRSDDLLDREFVIVEQLWNGSWEKIDSRLQPTQIALGKVLNTTDLLKLDYTYGVLESGTLNTAKNNGNIQSQTITVPTVGSSNAFTAVQTYNYDSLNRIDDATEKIGSTETWKQDYTFDRYGNRNFVEANTTTIPRNCLDSQTPPNLAICDVDRKMMNPSVNASNSRLSAADGYQFDAAGNTIRDPQNRKFTYDAENKHTKVESINSSGTVTGTIGEYFYDGDGRRVKKIAWINGQWEITVFVYDASSRLVAEYSTILNPAPQVVYLTTDHLSTPRINLSENGNIVARHDYQPYGEEIAGRIHDQYAVDFVRQRYTGKTFDVELQLTDLGSRNLSSTIGRFLVADYVESTPVSIAYGAIPFAFRVNPQTFNRYSYALNNPLRLEDPDGHLPRVPGHQRYTYRADINNLNDSPNIHIFYRGREVGRVAIKGTADNPRLEWNYFGAGVPRQVRLAIERLIQKKGWAPRPPLQPRVSAGIEVPQGTVRPAETAAPDSARSGSKGSGGRRGSSGTTLNALGGALMGFSLFMQLYEEMQDDKEFGYHTNILGQIVIVDLNKAIRFLPTDQIYDFGGHFYIIKGDKMVDLSDPGCELEQTDKGIKRICYA